MNIHLHIKFTTKQTKLPSMEIPIRSRPLLHPMLTNLRLTTDFDELMAIMSDTEFLSSDVLTKKYGDTVSFDKRVGLTGWKGTREEEENALVKLKGAAAIEIGNDELWKGHLIEYAGGMDGNKVRCIDIGIVLFSEENRTKRKTSETSSMTDSQQTPRKKRILKKTVVDGFRAPKTVIMQVLSPVQFHKNEERNRVRNTTVLGKVEIDWQPYILNAYEESDGGGSNSGSSSDCEILDGFSSVSMDEDIMCLNKKKKTDDDELCKHIYESVRHRLAYTLLDNKDGKYNIYKRSIGMKSCLYMTDKKALSPARINNTEELVEFIKEASKKESNWCSKNTMQIRVAFGSRRNDDPLCAASNFEELGILEDAEKIFSQEVFDQPIEFFNGKATSSDCKAKPKQIDRFLDQLYNSDQSQLYHGFLSEMSKVMKTTLTCNREFFHAVIGRFENEDFIPMEDLALQRMISFVTTTSDFKHLHPEKNRFPPHEPRMPPTKAQWQRTEEGRQWADENGNRNRNRRGGSSSGRSAFANLLISTISGTATESNTSATGNTNLSNTVQGRLGMVEVDTGVEVIKVAYSSNASEGNVVPLKTKLRDLVVKSKMWRTYDRTKKERIYEIVRENGTIFTTYKRDDLYTYTLGHLLEMMNFPLRGEVLKIRGGFADIVAIEDDEFDNLSL